MLASRINCFHFKTKILEVPKSRDIQGGQHSTVWALAFLTQLAHVQHTAFQNFQ